MTFLRSVVVAVRISLSREIVIVVIDVLHLNVAEDIHDQDPAIGILAADVAARVLEMGDDVLSLRQVLAVLVRPAVFLGLPHHKKIGTVNEVVLELRLVDDETTPVNVTVEIIIVADHHQDTVLVHPLQIVGEGVHLLPLHQHHKRKGRITKLRIRVTQTVEVQF